MIRVVLYGLGPIGILVGRQLATRDGFRIVGAVDVDPSKVGRDVGEIAGLARPLRLRVNPDARQAIKQSKPDVVVLCTSSSVQAVMPQIEGVLKAKVAIVTTTKELSYPVRRNASLASGACRRLPFASRAGYRVTSRRRQSSSTPSRRCSPPGLACKR